MGGNWQIWSWPSDQRDSLCKRIVCASWCETPRRIQHHSGLPTKIQFSSIQSLSRVQLFVTPWAPARQACLFIANSQSLLKLMSIESVMPSNHLILCHPLLLLPSVFPSTGVFSMSQFFAAGGQSIAKTKNAKTKTWISSWGNVSNMLQKHWHMFKNIKVRRYKERLKGYPRLKETKDSYLKVTRYSAYSRVVTWTRSKNSCYRQYWDKRWNLNMYSN